MNWLLQTLLGLAVVISVLMSPEAADAQSRTSSIAHAGSLQTSKNGSATQMPHSTLPLCPEAGLPAPHFSSAMEHHRVTLTWKASAPSAHTIGAPAGYCLYRSKKKGLAKMAMAIPSAHCGGCEQVNRVPIASTGCIDDLVGNSTYYYVVTAISSAGQTSSSSDEAIVEVPRRKPAAAAPTAYPSCRAPRISQ